MAAFAFALATSAAVRVASLDLCADEYLLALGRDDEIAAVSRLSRDPAENAAAARARRFPAYGGRLETLLPVRPDLLLAVGSASGRSTMAIARKMGWRVLVLPYPSSPSDVLGNLERVARALRHSERMTSWRRRFADIRLASRSLDTVFLGGGGQSVDPDGLSAKWMALAGFRQRPLAGGRITLEQLVLRPPAVILRSDYRSGQVSLGERWLDHPLVRRGPSRQVRVDGRPWTCGGPPMLDVVKRLERVR